MAAINTSPANQFSSVFINVDQPVGKGKANAPEDVLVVQALLSIVFIEHPGFFADAKARARGGDVVVSVGPRLGSNTPAMIALYQKVKLGRPKPEGFINKTIGSDRIIALSTIFNLFESAAVTNFVFTNPGDQDLIARLKRENPSLANLPFTARTQVLTGKQRPPREPDEPRLIDSSVFSTRK